MDLQTISTVIASAGNYDLTTLTNVKAELSITSSADDETLQRYITSASKAIANFCDRVFQVETVKDEFWPVREDHSFQVSGGIETIQLSRWPVVSVATITENSVDLTDGTDFRVNPKNGSLLRLNGVKYPVRWRSWPIAITYDAGYAPIPSDVEDAAIRLVKARYVAKSRDPFLKQENIPGVREVTYWIATGDDAANLPPDIADILDNYRVPVMA